MSKPPAAVPIEKKPEYYSSEFTLGELLDDPRTKVLVDQYLPKFPRKGIVRVLTLEQLSQYLGGGDDATNLFALDEALKQIPVQAK